MVFPVVGGDGKPTGYEISNSIRFNNDDSAYMQYTPSSASSSRTKWTWSGWIKRGHQAVDENNDYHRFFCVDADVNNYIITGFNVSAAFNVTARVSNTQVLKFETDAGQFRDHSAWYHIVMAYDSTLGTARNRFRVYFNGVEDTRALSTTPDQNQELTVLDTSEHNIGRDNHNVAYEYDGYMSEVHFIDGTQYAASDFGEFNDNGVWIPKEADVTYGTNGFRLEFKQTGTSANSSGVGADTSGNDNHLTPNNLAATDITVDTPTNNFATLNPLDKATNSSATYSEGNTKVVSGNGGDSFNTNFGVAKGKWYFEYKIPTVNNQSLFAVPQNLYPGGADLLGSVNYTTGLYGSAPTIYRNGSVAVADLNGTISDNDIVMWAMDLDNNNIYFGKGGNWTDGDGFDQSDFSNATAYALTRDSNDSFIVLGLKNGASGSSFTMEMNFGNAPFSISSGNADANGYGNFEYAVPSGYYALCTKNLAEYG